MATPPVPPPVPGPTVMTPAPAPGAPAGPPPQPIPNEPRDMQKQATIDEPAGEHGDEEYQTVWQKPFVQDILPRLTVHTVLPSIALHPTCSSRRLQLDDVVRSVAAQIADETYVPTDWQCCAFAGDRGMLHPELTASATRDEARSISAQDCSAHASVNRTCEIGMTRATGRAYVHLIELVERATRPLPTSDRG